MFEAKVDRSDVTSMVAERIIDVHLTIRVEGKTIGSLRFAKDQRDSFVAVTCNLARTALVCESHCPFKPHQLEELFA